AKLGRPSGAAFSCAWFHQTVRKRVLTHTLKGCATQRHEQHRGSLQPAWALVLGAENPTPAPNAGFERTPAISPPNVPPVLRPALPSDDSDRGDSPPAESNGWRPPSGRRRRTPGRGRGHDPPPPRTWRRAQGWQNLRSRRAGDSRGFVPPRATPRFQREP